MKNTIIAALLLVLSLAVPALAAQQDIAQLSVVTSSREALRTAINTQLSAVQSNFDEIYPIIEAGPVYANASAPADTKVVWIDTDQDNAIKVYVGGVWTVVGTAGEGSYTLPTAAADTLGGVKVGARLTITDGVLSADVQTGDGDDLGSAAYSDVVSLWTTCTGYLKSDGTCDTPSGSATYPSAAGVANWDGSAWGTSYTVGTAANNLVRLNASAQLPAVSGALLTNIPMPAWLPSAAPTADNMIIQATGGCSNITYTDQATCEANSGTWTPPVGAWTNIIDGLINDAGTGTDDLLSASEINSRISSAGAFYQSADGDLDTAAGADTAGNSKLFGTNSSGVVGWYDIPGAGSGIAHATADGKWYGSKDGAWVDLAPTFSSALPKWIDLVVGHNFTTGDLSWYNGQVWKASTTHVKVTGEYPSESSDDWELFTVAGGGSEPVSMQQVFSSSTTLVAGPGSKTKAITGVGWTTADIGCDAADTLGVSVKTASSVNGTYTEVGTISLSAAAQSTGVDISSWTDITAGVWVRIDLTGAPAAATECTVVIEGVEQ